MIERKLILTGLGGQGVVFLTRLLSHTAVALGQAIMVSETHGMSQRGGAVISHLKVGGSQSPLIRRGTADIMVALEASEAVRHLSFLRQGGSCFVNSAEGLPAEVMAHLDRLEIAVHSLPASQMAIELGAAAVANSVMAGFSRPFPMEALQQTIRDIAPRGRELNLQALAAGYQARQSLRLGLKA